MMIDLNQGLLRNKNLVVPFWHRHVVVANEGGKASKKFATLLG